MSSRNGLSVSNLFLIGRVFALAIVGRCVALFRLLFFWRCLILAFLHVLDVSLCPCMMFSVVWLREATF